MLLLLLGLAASFQQVQTGFLDRNVTVAGKSYHYQVYVPADYASKPNWPAILFLHGAGERGSDGLLQTNVGIGAAIRQNASRYPAIVVFPQAPLDSQWVGTPADMAVAALQQTLREFHVDPSRVYLTGLSMGGHGTWYVAYRHPELFAAIVPICGWVRDFPMFRGSAPVVPGDSATVMTNLAQRLGKVPIWIFHGEVDQVVNVNGSREPAAALKAAGADVRYSELLGMNHNSWDAAYGSDEFVHWLFAQQRH
ncbi:MAG TPA: PHB depolymerase family esterase [Gemmatimonadales bacterium]|nr:PHB depolymerase family esterase [Gemmatimonadales bacterium]